MIYPSASVDDVSEVGESGVGWLEADPSGWTGFRSRGRFCYIHGEVGGERLLRFRWGRGAGVGFEKLLFIADKVSCH